MIAVQTGVGSEDSLEAARYVVWVEGEDESIDAVVVREVLRGLDRWSGWVKGLGKSSGIRATARAMRAYHPHYYFVVDRDHFADEVVEETWSSFPDRSRDNLLIWRKRSVENYLLDPNILGCSRHLKPGFDIAGELEKVARKHVFMDIANAVILEVREQLKAEWIRLFRDPAPFDNKDRAWDGLKQRTEWAEKRKAANELLAETTLSDLFDAAHDRFLGSSAVPRHGEGRWRDLMAGKPLYNHLVNRAFEVVDREGVAVHGRDAQHAVAIDLIASGDCLPDDFVRLRQFIETLATARGMP